MTILKWHHRSRVENPEPNSYYTELVYLRRRGEDNSFGVGFFIDGLSLVFKHVTTCDDGLRTEFEDMGEFPDKLDNFSTMAAIKSFAQEAIERYIEKQDLVFCPSFEMVRNAEGSYDAVQM